MGETNMTIEFKAIEFDHAYEAFQYYDASGYGEVIISLGRKYYLTTRAEAERLAAARVEFAYVCDHEMPDGARRIMTVPVND
jgi:hypothetical protein